MTRRKKWNVSKVDKLLATNAAEELDIDSFSALLATSRGADSIDRIEEFFNSDALLSVDPFSIKDMDKASDRINLSVDQGDKICVYGDYDCDGVTSTALLYSYLETRGADVCYYIPERNEGYGLNLNAIDSLYSKGVKLIVTVDNGVSSHDEIKYAYEKGMSVVVSDHHKVSETLPECDAVVDPHRDDCPSIFKEMAGVGVAFKLVCALEGGCEDILLDEYGDLVAIGTIGDVVSLTDENRIMVRRGIANINTAPRLGISALLNEAGLGNKDVTSSTISFLLCPRINAAGRVNSPYLALKLLLSEDEDEAHDLAVTLNSKNIERQNVELSIYNEALKIINENDDIRNSRILVVSGEEWNQGVVGIVAAKLTENFGKPSIVISCKGNEAKGSCRSIEGFSIYDALNAVSDILDHFGGHTLAAGVSLSTDDISEFRNRINSYASGIDIPVPVQNIDCKLNPSLISVDIINSLSNLEPFGTGNPIPVFGLYNVTIEEIISLSEGKHTRIIFSKNGYRFTCLYFGMPELKFPYFVGDVVDLAVNLDKNVYNGDVKVSIIIKNIRYSLLNEDLIIDNYKLYEKFSTGCNIDAEKANQLIPERDIQVQVFKTIKNRILKNKNIEYICSANNDDGTNYGRYCIAVDIMLEMKILETDVNDRVFIPETTEKVNLEDSVILRKLRRFL